MCKQTAKPGFTLVEVLIALTITALLLTAIATVMHASFINYNENEQIAAVTQTTRTILNRMTREIRTAAAIDSTTNSLTIIPPNDGSGVTEIHYEFSDGQLLYRLTEGGQPTTHQLISSTDDIKITEFAVLREVGQDWQGIPCTKSITTRIVLKAGGRSHGMTTTSAPRRNQTY